MIDDETGRRIAVVLFSVMLITCGIWAFLDPELLSDYEPMGRRSAIKGFVKDAWGPTGGTVAIAFGALALCGVFVTRRDER